MTPQETIDRLEIQDLLTRYCHAVDRHDWHEFERLFAANATLDYTAFGGPAGSRAEISAYLEQVTSAIRGTQHTISTSLLIVDGDAATARTAGQAMMITIDDAAAIACASSGSGIETCWCGPNAGGASSAARRSAAGCTMRRRSRCAERRARRVTSSHLHQLNQVPARIVDDRDTHGWRPSAPA